MRQVYADGKWREGLPTEQGQRFRFMTAGGWQYGTYAPEPASEVVDMRITKQKFKLRFTQDERVLIRETAKTNPVVFDFQDLLDSGSHADLKDPVLITGLSAMERLELIAQGRANEILTAPILEHERYRG
jgi:hypothetical protein